MTKQIDITTLPQPPAGATFQLDKVISHFDPHLYCITSRHLSLNTGIELDIEAVERKGARCGVTGCGKRYDEHKQLYALQIIVPQNQDLNAVDGLNAYLNQIKDAATALGIDGFAFPSTAQIAAAEAKKPRGHIHPDGMGGFLNPPTHPEHTQSVRVGVGRNADHMSLTAAVDCDWLHRDTRTKAKEVLDGWQAPPLDSPEIGEWVSSVLGYFRDSYKGDGPEPECWNTDKMRYERNPNPELNADLHAGVRLIRKYYPAFVPTAKDFARASWGKKKA